MDFGHNISDTPTSLLICINLFQVIIILVLLLPIIDIVLLSKYIKDFTDSIKNNPITISLLAAYSFIVIFYGILSPTKTLTELKHSKQAREGDIQEEILRRIIRCTNASKNYILGAFSLFYLLVIIRLFDFVKFAAKLYEFSELMSNYDLVDIALIDDPDYKSTTASLIDEISEEEEEEENEEVPWPIRADFNKAERSQLRTFLKESPKKLAILAHKANATNKHASDLTSIKKEENKPKVDTEVSRKRSKDTINLRGTSTSREIYEIKPSSNENENNETINNGQVTNATEQSPNQGDKNKNTE